MDIRNFFGSAPKQSKKKEKATSQNGSKSTEATSEGGEDGRREHGDNDVGESLTTCSRSGRRTSPRKRRGPPPKYDDDGHDDDHDYEDGDDHDDDHDDKARRRGTRRGTPDDEEEVAIVEKKKTVKRRIVIESDSDDEGAAKEGEEEQETQEEKQQQEEEEDEEQHQQQQRDEFDTPTKQHRTHRIPSKLHESSPPKYHPPSSILSAHLPFLSHSLSKTHRNTHCDTARFSLESATPLCLSGLTFVFSGILTRGNNHHGADRRVLDTNARVSIASPTKKDYYKNRHFEVDDAPLDEGDELPRETAVEAVKMLGGRVTSAVSGKTDYLIAGNVLEDGRRVEEGSKYNKVLDLWEAWGDKHRGEYERDSEDEEDDEEENDRPRKKTAKTAKATKAKAKTNAKTAKDRDPNSLVEIVRGVDEFYGLISFLSEWKKTTLPPEERDRLEASQRQLETQTQSKERRTGHATSNTTSSPHTATASSTPSKATPPAKAIVNPYAKKAVSNPYASSNKSPSGATTSVTNPYAKKAVSNPYAKAATTHSPANGATKSTPTANTNDFTDAKGNTVRNALWADKYAPVSSRDILGNGDSVGKLARWLSTWETTWNSAQHKPKSLSAPKGPWKAALLSGPPGIGKTTTATLIAKESDRDVLELNASDARSKKALTEALGDVTGSQVLRFGPPAHSSHSNSKQTHKYKSKPPPPKRRCIIMDEVDGMGAGDRSGMAELLQMIKHSKVPIICICNDRSSPKVRSLAQYCLDLKFRRPTKTIIAKRAVEIGRMEGMHIEPNAAEAVAESCGNDIRQVLNCLQMWSCKKNDGGVGASTMTYKDLKDRQMEINKDEVLRVNIFDACKLIVEGSRGLAGADNKAVTGSLIKRTDAFFVDYMLMGLNVHQNYLKVSQGQFNDAKKKGDSDLEVRSLEQMHDATLAMSDFGVCEEQLRGGDQNWALLPLCSVLAVKVGHHAGGPNGGFLPGYPEFAGWLGKNSSRGKKMRLLQELRHHMNYRVSADAPELRMTYIPIIRQQFESLLFDKEGAKVKESIDLMDEYGLDRDDVFENLDEFLLASAKDVNRFGDLNSNVKAAVTRVYNQTAHTSQALVAEQGAGKSSRRKGGAASSVDIVEGGELDVVDDDKVAAVPDDDEGEDEDDLEELKSLFKKKGGKRSSAASKNGSGGGGGGKRAKKK